MKPLLIAAFLALTACAMPKAETVVRTERVAPSIPAALREKCDIPQPPPAGSTQRAVAVYVLDLNQSLEDCAAKHENLVFLIDDFKERVETNNATN